MVELNVHVQFVLSCFFLPPKICLNLTMVHIQLLDLLYKLNVSDQDSRPQSWSPFIYHRHLLQCRCYLYDDDLKLY